MNTGELLAIEDVRVGFRTRRGTVQALAGIDLVVERGRCHVIIGESGSGKSVLAHTLLGLLPRNVEVSGTARLHGEDLLSTGPARLRELRARRLAYVPQSPATSLNPVRRVHRLMAEAARAKGVPHAEIPGRAHAVLDAVGLDHRHVGPKYAHQLSGGMQQRVVGAMALLGTPDLVIADEPTSGLDRDRVADVAGRLRQVTARGAGLLVITHDLALAAELADRIAVLYGGHLVEERPAAEFFARPAHPYSAGLLDALPERGLHPIPGEAPDMIDMADECPFLPRCPQAMARCGNGLPAQVEHGGGRVRCELHAAR